MALLYCLILYAAGLSIGLARGGHRSRLLRADMAAFMLDQLASNTYLQTTTGIA